MEIYPLSALQTEIAVSSLESIKENESGSRAVYLRREFGRIIFTQALVRRMTGYSIYVNLDGKFVGFH